MGTIKNIKDIFEIERVTIPLACKEISIEFLVKNLEEYVRELFRLSNLAEITNEVFVKNKFSFRYANGRTYYIFVVSFPFTESREYFGCFKRGFFVFTNELKGMYFFAEVYDENFPSKNPRFKLQHFFIQNECLYFYDVMESTVESDIIMARQMPIFVYGFEHEGVAGFLVKRNDIYNKPNQDNSVAHLLKIDEIL